MQNITTYGVMVEDDYVLPASGKADESRHTSRLLCRAPGHPCRSLHSRCHCLFLPGQLIKQQPQDLCRYIKRSLARGRGAGLKRGMAVVIARDADTIVQLFPPTPRTKLLAHEPGPNIRYEAHESNCFRIILAFSRK